MPTTHTVLAGESLITIAKKYQFLNWKTIFDDPANAELRKQRPTANAILPGDKIIVPDKKPKSVSIPTTKESVITLAASKGVWNLAWTPAKGYCGDKVSLAGETNLTGTTVALKLKPRKGASPKLPELTGAISGAKIDKQDWVIQDVWLLKPPAEAFDAVDLELATKDPTIPSNVAVLTVEAMLDAPEQEFTATRTWSGFQMRPHFKQKIEKFACKVAVSFDILKCWGGYRVNLAAAGVTGTAGGCPWAGWRWGRATGLNAMQPNEYYDGTAWVALPAGFALTGTNHSAVSFYKTGTTFTSMVGGTWPEAFADYDFNSVTYTKRRADWVKNTHDVWTDKFHIRRKTCRSHKGTRCCIYTVEVTLTLNVVTTYSTGVIGVCPGALRSNAANWFLDDARIEVAAHESGHHMDNPDEYAGGAVDPTLSGDGAVAGIDDHSIMGANMTKVKKRHYHAFADMTTKLIKAKYGRDYDYEVVDK
ncbi:hypothetical protein [Sorangium sp. So ce341]|uniref:hypothetical protein n=1 Tax=Sorangium sp. So ce341 TaxID=3133302 RepID=UPI003F64375F